MTQLTPTELRNGIAWATNKEATDKDEGSTPWVWFWEAIQGDFNDERSTSQILTDAALSMIPGVDQICDVRDLIANCRKISKDFTDGWAWLGLALTLIGLFPTLGSLVKGVLKIVFLHIRRRGADAIAEAVSEAMTWVDDFLRRREVQRYLDSLHVDEVYAWLAAKTKELRAQINVEALLAAFDRSIRVLEGLVNKVSLIPKIGSVAATVLDEVRRVRLEADGNLRKELNSVLKVLDEIAWQLERKMIYERRAILNANHVHFRGTLPEASAITLMTTATPRPKWLTQSATLKWSEAKVKHHRPKVASCVQNGWPDLTDSNIKSFHKLAQDEIKGPARLYRIVSPNSRAMGDCWVSEEIFKKIQSSPDPKAAWRKYLGVWPDWNANGQFVIYELKAGDSLKVWRGPTSSQMKAALPNETLEGGWEQVVFKIDRNNPANDTMRYYELGGPNRDVLIAPINQQQYDALTNAQKQQYVSIREQINHPNILGPFDTGWGYTDFGGATLPQKIGLPSLKGQVTN